jgi:SNF2 family DNA or RNA helicase
MITHLPAKMTNLLKTRLISPYQHNGLRWLAARETDPVHPGGFLCDEMGLGKTVQMLATMCVNPVRTLIIVPKSIVSQWRDEIMRFAPHFTVNVFDGPKRVVTDADITIAPYSVLPTRVGQPICPLLRVNWGRVILDEGHEIRNRRSKTHVAACAISAPIRWILTGTPIFNSMADFANLCGFIGFDRRDVQAMPELFREKYVLRRTKTEVAEHNKRLELPPCDFQNLELEMYPEEAELYQEVFDRAQGIIQNIIHSENRALHQMEILEALMRTRQALTWPQTYLNGIAAQVKIEPEEWKGRSKKLETLIDLIDSHPKEKTLVFYNFTGEMLEIKRRLGNRQVFRLDGSVDKVQKDAAIVDFKGSTVVPAPVFLIQIKAGGVGINLQEATRIYITAPSWNPATELQAIARAHRTGQTQKVTVRRMVYIGTEQTPSVEQSIMALQAGKATLAATLLNDTRLETQIPNVTKTKLNIRALAKIFAL